MSVSGAPPWLEAPPSWPRQRIKNLGTFFGGGTPSKENAEYWAGDIPWVSPKDMKQSVVSDAEDHITPRALRESASRLVPTASMLVVVRSGILQHTIPVAVNSREVALNQDMKAFVAAKGFSVHFLRYILQGWQDSLLLAWRKVGATVESLDFDLLRNTAFAVPDRSTQHAVVSFLDRKTTAIDDLIEKKERLIDLLQEKRQALITQAVTKGLDPHVPMKESAVTWFPEVPTHWKVLRLRHACSSIFLGLTSKVDYVNEGGVPLVRALNIAGGTLDFSDARNISEEQHRYLTRYRRAQRDDVLLSKSGSIGTAAIVKTDAQFSIYESIFALRARPDVLTPRFLLAILRAQTTQAQYMAHLVGMGVTHLNMSDIIDVRIPVPPPSDQILIAEFVDSSSERLVKQEQLLQQSVERIREYRQALITAAVTGKIDVSKEAA